MRMKTILVIAFTYFVWHLPKTLKSIEQKRDQTLKDKNTKNKITSGSNEEESIEVVKDHSQPMTKKFEFKWKVSPEEAKDIPQEKDNIDDLIKKIEFSSQNENLDIREVEDTLQKILDSEWGEESMAIDADPIHMLSLEKEQDMFYSLQRKTFVPVKNNIEVIPVDNPFAKQDQTNFYLINNELFDIDPKNVVMVGWN